MVLGARHPIGILALCSDNLVAIQDLQGGTIQESPGGLMDRIVSHVHVQGLRVCWIWVQA